MGVWELAVDVDGVAISVEFNDFFCALDGLRAPVSALLLGRRFPAHLSDYGTRHGTASLAARQGTTRPTRRCPGMALDPLRRAALLVATALALPITCSQAGDGTFTGGIQPSPAGRVNPAEPGFTNGGNGKR